MRDRPHRGWEGRAPRAAPDGAAAALAGNAGFAPAEAAELAPGRRPPRPCAPGKLPGPRGLGTKFPNFVLAWKQSSYF